MNGDHVTCCIAGGGPAGMMLGLLLARAGIDVVVLEKHKDFLRDFRGDTVHPSTLEVLHELGLLEAFLQCPHQKIDGITAVVGNIPIRFADLTHVPTRCKFIAMMPQWDFLNFLASEARKYPNFHLMMEAEATGLTREGECITGVTVSTPQGERTIHAAQVIAADGRHSALRQAARLPVKDLGAPIDVLWFSLPKGRSENNATAGYFNAGRVFVTIDRGHYWQCAFVITKDTLEIIRGKGVQAFRDDIARLAAFAPEHLAAIGSWDDIKLLSVMVNRLEKWWLPGFLCIGDAAHAMSPLGGVGINLAIQDAVATANILTGPLRSGHVPPACLRSVQRRREFPTRVTQALQVTAQNRIIRRVLAADAVMKPPAIMRLFNHWPWIRRIPAYIVGVGIRPEHVRLSGR